jgi:hypothetical protein
MSSYNDLDNLRIIEAETLDQRLERLYEYYDKNHKWANVEAVLTHPEGSYRLKEWMFTHNLVTDDGEIYYAQQGAGATPTDDFAGAGRFILRTTADTPGAADQYQHVLGPIALSNQVIDPTYPKVNDTADAENTGDGVNVISYRVSYTTTSFSDPDIEGGAIHIGGASPGATSHLLTHFTMTPFAKTTSDTLKVFVNHGFTGV